MTTAPALSSVMPTGGIITREGPSYLAWGGERTVAVLHHGVLERTQERTLKQWRLKDRSDPDSVRHALFKRRHPLTFLAGKQLLQHVKGAFLLRIGLQ